MAWFGEGFSSLKGQITNFTKEIVSNNIVPIEDIGLSSGHDEKETPQENKKLNSHVQQLEAHCKEQDEEINKLRIENLQLRKMFSDGSTRDRHHSEEATFECDTLGLVNANIPLSSWEEEVVAEPFLGQDHAPDPVNNVQKLPKDTKLEEELISLRSRLRKTFQEKVLLEQSCSRLEKDVSLLSQQVNKTKQQQLLQAEEEARRNAEVAANLGSAARQQQSTQTGDISGSSKHNCHCMTPELSSLIEENDRLKQERVEMRQEMTSMARVVQDLESQVAVSQDENSNLSTGLEELDIRHQQEIEQIMNMKDSTQKRYDLLNTEHEDIKKKYEDLIKENTSKTKTKSSTTETQTSKEKIDDEKKAQEMVEANLTAKIQSLITFPIPQEFLGKDEASGHCFEKVAGLVKMCVHLKETIDTVRSKEKNLLQEIKERDEELQGLESENSTLREKLLEFSKERESLPPILENSEELEVLEHKCAVLENENAILIEVRSNLEAEINTSRAQMELVVRRLQASEAEVKNYENLQTEISKYRDIESDLKNKVKDMSIKNENLVGNLKVLQEHLDILKNKNEELEFDKRRLQEMLEDYESLNEKISKLQGIELEMKKVTEELLIEKSLRLQVDAEKEALIVECARFNDEIKLKDNLIYKLQQENSVKSQLEEEKEQLLNETTRLEEIGKLYGNVKEELEEEQCRRKQLEEEKELLYADLEEVKKQLNQSLEHNNANDMKFKNILQKNKNFESQILELSEKSDAFKVESDSKDRKLCEVFLEKSVLEKELENLRLSNSQVIEELSNTKKIEQETVRQELELNNAKIAEYYSRIIKDLEEKISLLENEKSFELKEKELLMSELNDKRNLLFAFQNNSGNLIETKTSEVQTILDENHERKISEVSLNSEIQRVSEELFKIQIEKDQLIQTLQAKHVENVQYHGEIQRLNALLSAQLNKTEQVSSNYSVLTKTNVELQQKLEAKDVMLSTQQTANDKQISVLKQQVETLQNQLEYVSQLLRVADRQEAEGQPASDSPSLKTSSNKTFSTDVDSSYNIEELLENLKQEQLRNKYLQNEVQEQHEKEEGSLKEIERLRLHLVNVEENYTHELVRAEEQVKELQQRLSQADERVKSSSTAYTSASIRSNQQVESLGKQVRLLSEQKEKILAQLTIAEDKLHKQAAALTNLQIVLEQFQRDKERDIGLETERIKQTLQHSENKNADLYNEIKSLQLQLKEAKEGLSAASRLNEQLDRKSQTIAELKHKVTGLTEALSRAEERVHAASLSVEGKVDRCLVRNLIVGYFCAPPSSRQQALSIVATVLDLSQEDRHKIGLEPTSKGEDNKQQSLSEAFVRFLENESRPQTHLRLPIVEEDKESRSRKTSLSDVGLPNARRTSGSVLKDVLKQDRML